MLAGPGTEWLPCRDSALRTFRLPSVAAGEKGDGLRTEDAAGAVMDEDDAAERLAWRTWRRRIDAGGAPGRLALAAETRLNCSG